MNVWRTEYVRPAGTASEVIYKRHECSWILSQHVAKHVYFNPRHLPVVQVETELNYEAYLLYLSIRRIIRGYYVHTSKELPPSWP